MSQVTQHRSLTLPGGTTPGTLSFDQFDPALGTLQSITIGLWAGVTGSVSVENYDPVAVQAKAGFGATVSVFGPALYSLANAQATASATASLGAHDGSVDFAGGSGTVLAGITGSGTGTGVFDASLPQAAGFVGTGMATLTLTSLDSMAGSAGGGMRLQSALESIVGDVTVTYNFVPNDGGGGSVGTTTVINTDVPVVTAHPFVQTITSARVQYSTDWAKVGMAQSLPVARFDPALGTLVAVNLRMTVTEAGHAAAENMQPIFTSLALSQSITTKASAGGVALGSATASGFGQIMMNGADGTVDFAGVGGGTADWLGVGTGTAKVTDAAALAAFTGAGTVDMALASSGTTTASGPSDVVADIAAKSWTKVEVSYSYTPVSVPMPLAVANGTAGTQAQPAPKAYGGPVDGVVNEFVQITPDNLSITAATDDWYIRTGNGTDAIAVRDGHNVLDGGGGSNFLVGGAGRNDFFLDAIAPAAPLWSTIIGMHAGDTLTIWGYEPSNDIFWHEGEGAPGSTGLTLHMPVPGGFEAVATLAGYSFASFTEGKLTYAPGTAGGIPYMLVSAA